MASWGHVRAANDWQMMIPHRQQQQRLVRLESEQVAVGHLVHADLDRLRSVAQLMDVAFQDIVQDVAPCQKWGAVLPLKDLLQAPAEP